MVDSCEKDTKNSVSGKLLSLDNKKIPKNIEQILSPVDGNILNFGKIDPASPDDLYLSEGLKMSLKELLTGDSNEKYTDIEEMKLNKEIETQIYTLIIHKADPF